MGKLRSRWPWNRSSTSIDPQQETDGGSALPNFAPPTANSTPSEQSSRPIFPDGVEVLHDCPDANVDICLVHGLTGNRTSTWTARGQSVPWPKTLLPLELPKACILTYGYDAYVVSKSVASSNRLVDHATNLLTDLTNDRRRRNASSRPLIFVAHSLGGLVCKEAILLSRNNPNRSRRDLFTHIKGVVFMGTPHKGSWIADWARIPAAALGLVKSTNKSLLEVLETNNQYLQSIHARFLAMMREQREAGRQLEVACFFEELPLSTVGQVVSKESATFEGYDPITIHANHGGMVKFGSTEENGFKRVVGELTAWELEIGQSVPQPETNAWTGGCVMRGKDTTTKPRMHYLPFSRNKNFVGRDDVIANLKRLLFTDLDGQRVALVGLGGTGKTQIALQFAYLVKNDIKSHEHCSVIWMPALSMASFEQACSTIINRFGIVCASDEDPKEIFREFLSSDKAAKWFLVIDNADDMSVLYGSAQQSGGIAQFIPNSKDGCTLFTTRSQEVAVHVAQNNVVELPEMDQEEAKALLQKSLIEKNQMQDTELVDELLQKLTYLPLAITQASAYINTKKIRIKEYLRLFQNTDQDMVELLSRGLRDDSHYRSTQGAVATTWVVSFNQIRDMHEDASKLLSFAAYIEPKAIPRILLPKLDSEQKMTDAIGTLCGYNFLSRREHSEIFDMHSLVHLATRMWNEEQGRGKEIRQMTLARVAEVFPTDEWENRDLWRQYLPHALRLLVTVGGSENEDSWQLGPWVGRCLLADGRAREAVTRLRDVVAIREKTLAEDHPSRLASQHVLAMAYRTDGQIKKAMELLEHVVAIREKALAEDHLSRLASQHVLAGVYLDDGQIKKAMELLEHVVAIREKTLAEDHPDRLASQHVLAMAYRTDGQIKKALELLEHVVAIREKTLAEDHPDRLASQHELARAYQTDGQIKKAMELLEHVVAIREKTLAEDHPARLASQNVLAIAYLDDGQIKKALELLEHVVAIREKTLAEDHPDRWVSKDLLQSLKDQHA